jgi:hypothetical protein
MQRKLTTTEKSVLSHADSAILTAKFELLANNWKNGRWLSSRNRYRVDCIKKIKADTQTTGSLQHSELGSYIAASSAIHCMDGWGYVSRAIEAELSGDTYVAKHLAYYAELRAAMSILASAGVGAFDKIHFALKSNQKCDSIKNISTHLFVWEALECWAKLPSATDQILKTIRPGGKPLSEWLMHFPPTAGGGFRSILAEQWLMSWGLDLKHFALDREARNSSSYRPTDLTEHTRSTLSQSISFMRDFWLAHEPSAINPFKEIDRHLLRRSLSIAFKAHHPAHYSPRKVPMQYARLIAPMMHAMLPTTGDYTDAQWKDFVCFKLHPEESRIISYAETNHQTSSTSQHLQMISRAILLLRLATGATRDNFRGIAKPDMEKLSFWWNPIGEERGIWDTGNVPNDFQDLWQDIQESLDQIDSWQATGGRSKKDLFNDAAVGVKSLSSCERIALWGLGL